jgi:hypothetical protein
MKQRAEIFLRGACLAIFTFFCLATHVAAAQEADPASESIMQTFAPLLAEYSKIFMGDGSQDCIDFALSKNMVSPGLKGLLQKERLLSEKNDGIGNLDFDLFFNAQDNAGKPLSIVGITSQGDTAVMQVKNGFAGEKPYDFLLVKDAGRWVIDNVRYPQDGQSFSLRDILNQP